MDTVNNRYTNLQWLGCWHEVGRMERGRFGQFDMYDMVAEEGWMAEEPT